MAPLRSLWALAWLRKLIEKMYSYFCLGNPPNQYNQSTLDARKENGVIRTAIKAMSVKIEWLGKIHPDIKGKAKSDNQGRIKTIGEVHRTEVKSRLWLKAGLTIRTLVIHLSKVSDTRESVFEYIPYPTSRTFPGEKGCPKREHAHYVCSFGTTTSQSRLRPDRVQKRGKGCQY